jgi:hypothetical protein
MPSNECCTDRDRLPADEVAALLAAIAAVAPELTVAHLALVLGVLARQVEVPWPPVDVP